MPGSLKEKMRNFIQGRRGRREGRGEAVCYSLGEREITRVFAMRETLLLQFHGIK
jgi:hypothetical protein